jgi:uncharacterized membrane protein YecN with MAPEG domain
MSKMHITPFYAAILAILYVGLSVRTLRLRRLLGIPIGDSGNERMLRAIRAHGNFAEYVPLALLLTFMAEVAGANTAIIHFVCALLLLGRFSHAFGVSRTPETYAFRVFGMAMTFTAMLVCALTLLVMPLG